MVAAVVQRRLDVDHLVARENSAFHRFLDTLADRLDVFARNHAANDRVDKLVPGAGFGRFDLDFGVTVLAASAGLPNELPDSFCRFANRLSIGNLRTARRSRRRRTLASADRR